MRLRDIRDQEAAMDTLRRALGTGKVPHAYLFTGPPGVGKLAAAGALAMALNCEERTDDACGACPACRKMERGVHPDVIRVFLPPQKKRIPIEAVRELEKSLALRAHEGRAKVAIIEPADLLTEPAANALLKTLEEPRSGSFLVLVTSRAFALLPTVRSRCQLVRFKPLRAATVAAILEERGAPAEEARTAAAFSGGSVEQAEHQMGSDLGGRIDAVIALLEGTGAPTPERALAAIFAIAGERERSRDDVLDVLDLAETLLADVIFLRTSGGGAAPEGLDPRLAERLRGLSETLPLGRAGFYVATVHRTAEKIRTNNWNPRLALEGLVMSLRGAGSGALSGSGFYSA